MSTATAERPRVAVVTGSSRDVGEYVSYGLAQAGWDVLGLYRNPQHDEDQAEIIRRVQGYRVKMRAVRTDLSDPETPNLLLAELNENFGGKLGAIVLNAATGFSRSIAEARVGNVDANLRLVDKLLGNLAEGGVVVYATSDPAHTYHTIENPEEQLGDYNSVANTKNEAEQVLRGRRDLTTGFVVGNGLEGTFATRVLKRRYKGLVDQWQDRSGDGVFPTAMDMASAMVRVTRGNYPSGYTEYVGVDTPYQLYHSSPSLVGAPPMIEGSVMSRKQVEEVIPHRWPFNFIGGVESIKFGEKATGWLVDLTHPDINWREGHFPQRSIVPGVITQEALLQLGALTALGSPEHRGKIAAVTRVADLRYRQLVTPGEKVRLEVEVTRSREQRGVTFGRAMICAINSQDKLALEGNVSFSLLPSNAAA